MRISVSIALAETDSTFCSLAAGSWLGIDRAKCYGRNGRRPTARRSRDMIDDPNLEHDPEKHVLDPDRGWTPVFGKDHAPPIA